MTVEIEEEKETKNYYSDIVRVKINKIIVNLENRRKVNEDTVNDLVKSILKIGLLNPIIITDKKELIAGLHRLEAFKKLLKKEIPCIILKKADLGPLFLKLIELDENLIRYEGHYLDRGNALFERKKIYEKLYPETKQGMQNRWYKDKTDNVSVLQSSFTKDTAKKLNLSERTIEREIQLSRDIKPEVQEFIKEKEIGKSEALLIAREEPEIQQKIVEKLSSGTDRVKIALIKIKREEKPNTTPKLPQDTFNVIVADPAWKYDFYVSENRSPENHYQTMELEEICNLEIPAAKDSILFLWTTTAKIDWAMKVIEVWGFVFKTSMVWVKDKIGMGHYVRNQHELVLIATKGQIGTPSPAARPSSIFYAKREEHSKKPEILFELIEQMYPEGKYLELFSRASRENWVCWGNEV